MLRFCFLLHFLHRRTAMGANWALPPREPRFCWLIGEASRVGVRGEGVVLQSRGVFRYLAEGC